MQSHFSASYYVAVTPSDSTQLSFNALYVGTSASNAGTVVVKNSPTGTAVTFKNVPQGTILWIESSQGYVMAATTATDIVALSW